MNADRLKIHHAKDYPHRIAANRLKIYLFHLKPTLYVNKWIQNSPFNFIVHLACG